MYQYPKQILTIEQQVYQSSSELESTFKCINGSRAAKNSKADLTKHFLLKPVRLLAECYDKHFAIFILIENKLNLNLVYLEHLL